eukprot:16430715-Heterocapsa_arctica.AAC.1
MPKTHMISVAKLGAGADARGILRSAGAEGAEASRLQRAGTEGRWRQRAGAEPRGLHRAGAEAG